MEQNQVRIAVDSTTLTGDLMVPEGASGLVIFAHGSGSSRLSPRNLAVAGIIRAAGIGTLLFDLLTQQEEARDAITAELRFDIAFLARRLLAVTLWVRDHPPAKDTRPLKNARMGYFGASTGAAAALVAAAELGDEISAIVSRGGRPDLAENALPRVKAPTLLLVGAFDIPVIAMNRRAFEHLQCEKQLVLVPGASHLFEEPGTLERVAGLAADWFHQHLSPPG